VSAGLYTENEEAINRPRFQRSQDTIADALLAIRQKGFWVRPTETVRACTDPDDDIFLECAGAAQANYLVTGNLKHFPTSWAGTRVVTARWLLDSFSCHTEGEPL
jgi:putative PIN family toxin of toxin-antitoxin system